MAGICGMRTPTRVAEEDSETAYMTNRAMEYIREAGARPWCLHLELTSNRTGPILRRRRTVICTALSMLYQPGGTLPNASSRIR